MVSIFLQKFTLGELNHVQNEATYFSLRFPFLLPILPLVVVGCRRERIDRQEVPHS